MIISAIDAISRECCAMVRLGGSTLTPAVLGRRSQDVPPPRGAHRLPVSYNRLSPSPRAEMPGFAPSREYSGRGIFIDGR
jgi:hypothetical protein